MLFIRGEVDTGSRKRLKDFCHRLHCQICGLSIVALKFYNYLQPINANSRVSFKRFAPNLFNNVHLQIFSAGFLNGEKK